MQTFDKLIELYKKIKPNADTSKITPDSRLTSEIGLDSLSVMLLSLAIEDEFDIRFKNTEGFETLNDVCGYIQQQTKNKQKRQAMVSAVS